MKRSLSLLLAAGLLFTIKPAQAQISAKIYGNTEDLMELKTRTLAVELMSADPKLVAKLSKKEKDADRLDEYQGFIKRYNALIKDAATKYWKLNSKIEFKTKDEIEAIRKNKDKSYALLHYFEIGDNEVDFVERSPLTVPAMYYTRPEITRRMPDYRAYMPSSFLRKEVKYMESDFRMLFITMQAAINYNIETDKAYEYLDFIKKQVKENCGKLETETLLIDDKYLYKSVSPDEAYKAYEGNMKLVPSTELDKAFTDAQKATAVLFSVPYGIGKGSFGPINSSALVYMKVIVDAETGAIIGLHKAGIGSSYVSTLTKGDFKDLKDCD